MATESADGTEVAVTLPPDLEEWLEDRAATLEVDRDELLVQLVSAYRATADGDGELRDALAEGVDAEALEDVKSRLSDGEETISSLDDRVDGLESELAENVEDLRSRVLQLRDAVADTAPENHSHREFATLQSNVEELAADLESLGDDLEDEEDRIAGMESRLAEAEGKLTRLARVVVSLRRTVEGEPGETTLEELRLAANQHGVAEAACSACDRPVDVGLLTEAACPHCGTAFEDLEPPEPGLGRVLGFRGPRLRCVDPPALEGGDE